MSDIYVDNPPAASSRERRPHEHNTNFGYEEIEMHTIEFLSFGRPCSGRLVTREGDLSVVYARNPYGRHNLVLVSTNEAFRHGNTAVVACAAAWMSRRRYRRVRKFLAARGVGIDWIVGEA